MTTWPLLWLLDVLFWSVVNLYLTPVCVSLTFSIFNLLPVPNTGSLFFLNFTQICWSNWFTKTSVLHKISVMRCFLLLVIYHTPLFLNRLSKIVILHPSTQTLTIWVSQVEIETIVVSWMFYSTSTYKRFISGLTAHNCGLERHCIYTLLLKWTDKIQLITAQFPWMHIKVGV